MFLALGVLILATAAFDDECSVSPPNQTAKEEQAHIEQNQAQLNRVQPSPIITWSLERDNLIKRFKLQNDRTVSFYMYVFIEGVADPVGYYQVNKVSSVNSQLTATQQLVHPEQAAISEGWQAIESPAEDGSYGTNGNAVFGFTPEDVYVEHNMKYLVSSVPLQFTHPVIRLAVINTSEAQAALDQTKKAMSSK